MHEVIHLFLTPGAFLNPAPDGRLMLPIEILKAELLSHIDFPV